MKGGGRKEEGERRREKGLERVDEYLLAAQ